MVADELFWTTLTPSALLRDPQKPRIGQPLPRCRPLSPSHSFVAACGRFAHGTHTRHAVPPQKHSWPAAHPLISMEAEVHARPFGGRLCCRPQRVCVAGFSIQEVFGDILCYFTVGSGWGVDWVVPLPVRKLSRLTVTDSSSARA